MILLSTTRTCTACSTYDAACPGNKGRWLRIRLHEVWCAHNMTHNTYIRILPLSLSDCRQEKTIPSVHHIDWRTSISGNKGYQAISTINTRRRQNTKTPDTPRRTGTQYIYIHIWLFIRVSHRATDAAASRPTAPKQKDLIIMMWPCGVGPCGGW